MRRRIVIAGDSPLSLFVAKLLDEKCGPLAHLDIVVLTRDEKIIYWPDLQSLIGVKDFLAKKTVLEHAGIFFEKIRSVNLRDQRLVTDRHFYDFDFLVLDQTPVYTSDELKSANREFSRLLTHLQSLDKQGRRRGAQIRIRGESVYSWQLALAITCDLKAMRMLGRIKVFVEATPDFVELKSFLQDNDVGQTTPDEVAVGFQISSPSPPLDNGVVRGAHLDGGGRIITDAYLSPEGFPCVFVVDSPVRALQNLFRPNLTLAKLIASNLIDRLESRRPKPVEPLEPALLLKCAESLLLKLGRTASRRGKARLAYHLDRRIFYRLG